MYVVNIAQFVQENVHVQDKQPFTYELFMQPPQVARTFGKGMGAESVFPVVKQEGA